VRRGAGGGIGVGVEILGKTRIICVSVVAEGFRKD
jgi:hypothetical protein